MNVDPRLKVWRRLLSTETPTRLKSIKILSSPIFAEQTIALDRVTAVTGYHGTGKSLFLLTIEALFGFTVPMLLPPYIRRGSSKYRNRTEVAGIVEVTVSTDSGTAVRQVDLGDPPEKRNGVWQDVLNLGTPLTDTWWPEYCGPLYAFSELAGLDDHAASESALADTDHYDLSADDLRGLARILGKRYDRVTVYRLPTDDLDGWDYPIPMVFAEKDGAVTDSTKMSAGELWVHYLFWFLRGRAAGSAALVDEPESHISARGQGALADEISRYCLRNNLQLLVATHSPEIVSRFPLSNIRMCVSTAAHGIALTTPSSSTQLHDTVGVKTAITGVVLVEDEAAGVIVKSILSLLDITLARQLEVVAAGGTANVLAGLRSMQAAKRLPVAAILDGDQRDSESGAAYRLYHLPGSRSPERELLDLPRKALFELASLLGKSVADVNVALSNASTLEHQYQVSKLAEELGLPEPLVWHSLITVWMKNATIRLEAVELVDRLRAMVDSRHR